MSANNLRQRAASEQQTTHGKQGAARTSTMSIISDGSSGVLKRLL
jgi:hypothetical protein